MCSIPYKSLPWRISNQMASQFSSEHQSYDPAWDVSSCSELKSSQQESPMQLCQIRSVSNTCPFYCQSIPQNGYDWQGWLHIDHIDYMKCRSNLTDQTDTEARGYYEISILIPKRVKIYAQNEDKYQTKMIPNAIITHLVCPIVLHKAWKCMHTDHWVTQPWVLMSLPTSTWNTLNT